MQRPSETTRVAREPSALMASRGRGGSAETPREDRIRRKTLGSVISCLLGEGILGQAAAQNHTGNDIVSRAESVMTRKGLTF